MVIQGLQLIRIGFFPILLLSNFSMIIGAGRFHLWNVPPTTPLVFVVFANIGWMLYGSILNDICDRNADRHNIGARKVLARASLSSRQIAALIGVAALLPLALDAVSLTVLGPSNAAAFVAVSIVGIVLATAYSMPPVRARARLFGASWTLMSYHPFCFLRIIALGWLGSVGGYVGTLVIISFFLWASHGITTVALKDIPDTFADREDGIRSIPIILGARAALIVTLAFIGLAVAIGIVTVSRGIVDATFLFFLFPIAILYCLLAVHFARWLTDALIKDIPGQTPRKLFHAVAYCGTWGILVPSFMFYLSPQ